ncbi:MAG: hypothetical protein QF757_02680 [Candidatus Marinimicrobia bacterium]|nr:hypothetical protein [Candidatus Neomarinimicrobiota bacterium]
MGDFPLDVGKHSGVQAGGTATRFITDKLPSYFELITLGGGGKTDRGASPNIS